MEAIQNALRQQTKDAISFTIGPGESQRILAILLPILKDKQQTGTRTLEGKIGVYETKNKDYQKWISYSATVCMQQHTYRKLCPAAQLPLSGTYDLALSGVSSAISASHNPTTPPSGEKATPLLGVMPVKINLGNVRVNEVSSLRVQVFNLSSHSPVWFEVEPMEEPLSIKKGATKPPGQVLRRFSYLGGELAPLGFRTVEFDCCPITRGLQKHRVAFKNTSNGKQSFVTVSLNAQPPDYISFPQLGTEAVHKNEMSFGLCYLSPNQQYAKVYALEIQSQWHDSLSLALKSNLTKQVFVFADAALSTLAKRVKLLPHSTTTVYICLQPSIQQTTQSISSTSDDGSASGTSAVPMTSTAIAAAATTTGASILTVSSAGVRLDLASTTDSKAATTQQQQQQHGLEAVDVVHSRSLIGGIRIKIYVPDRSEKLHELALRFSATVGRSVLHPLQRMIDLGRIERTFMLVTGVIPVTNLSDRFPLHFAAKRLEAAAGMVASPLSRCTFEFHALPSTVDPCGTGGVFKRELIKFGMRPHSFGLSQEWIQLSNIDCPDQVWMHQRYREETRGEENGS